jgi:hypothetical protein
LASGRAAVNAGIAYVGATSTAQRQAALPDANLPGRHLEEGRNLHRLLLINAGLDVLYILGGLALMRGNASASQRGTGWGIVLQGAALLVFDIVHARELERHIGQDAT